MQQMSADEMAAMSGPSKAASMICSDEIGSVVKHSFELAQPPSSSRHWSTTDLMFSCTYHVPGGTLRMSVHDAPDASSGASFFHRLRASLPGATSIRGVQSLGFPALQTPAGTVAFLKDGKTLQVDATRVSVSSLPHGLTREDAAYGVAAAVIACWTE